MKVNSEIDKHNSAIELFLADHVHTLFYKWLFFKLTFHKLKCGFWGDRDVCWLVLLCVPAFRLCLIFSFPGMGDSPSSFLGYFWDICSLTIRCTILEVRGTGMKLYFQKSSDTEKNFKVFCKATVPYVQYPMPVRRMFYFFDLGIKHCCYCHRYAIQYIYSEAVLHGKPAVQ